MAQILALFVVLLFATHPVHAQDQKDTGEITQQEIDEISKAFGFFMGSNLKTPGMNLNLDQVVEGLREGAAGKEAPMTQMEFQQKMRQFQMKMRKKIADENLSAAEKFLSENKGKTSVVELEPGKLQYMIMEKGYGPAIEEHNRPQVEYTGTFLDGTEFGSSEKAGRPLTIPLDNTIPGFKKGLIGMREGESRRLWIHPELGYGTSGRLQPNALLVFDIKVIKANEMPAQDKEESSEEEEGTDTSFIMPAW